MGTTDLLSNPKTIRNMRKRLGIRQAQMTLLTGINSSKISRFESGKAELSEGELEKMLQVIDGAMAERAESGQLQEPKASAELQAFGKMLRNGRNRYGITQDQLAREVDVTKTTVSLVENGYFTLDDAEAEQWWNALEKLTAKQRNRLGLPQHGSFVNIRELMTPVDKGKQEQSPVQPTGEIEALRNQIAAQEALIAAQKELIAALQGRIAELER